MQLTLHHNHERQAGRQTDTDRRMEPTLEPTSGMENATDNQTVSIGAFGERSNVRTFPPELELLHSLNASSPPHWSAAQLSLVTLASWITLAHLLLALVILGSGRLRRQPRYLVTLNLCLCNLLPAIQAFLALYAVRAPDFRCAVVAPLAALGDFLSTASALFCVLAFLLEEALCLVLQPPALASPASSPGSRRSVLALLLLAPWVLVAALTPLALPVTLGLGPCQVSYREPQLDGGITVGASVVAYFLPAFLALLCSASLAVLVKNKWVTLPEAGDPDRSCMSRVKESQTVIVLVGLAAAIPEGHYFFNRVRGLSVVELARPQATVMWLRLLRTSVFPLFWLFYRDVRQALCCCYWSCCRASHHGTMTLGGDVETASCTGTFRFQKDSASYSPHSPRVTRLSTRLRADSVRSVVSGRPSSNASADSSGFCSMPSAAGQPRGTTGRTVSTLEQARLSIESRPRIQQPSFLPLHPQHQQLCDESRPRCNTSSAADYARRQGVSRPNRQARSPSDPGPFFAPFFGADPQQRSPASRSRAARPGSALEEARAISGARPPSVPRLSRQTHLGVPDQGSPVALRRNRLGPAADPCRGMADQEEERGRRRRTGEECRSSSADRVHEAHPPNRRPLSAVSHARNLTALAHHRGGAPFSNKSVPNLSCSRGDAVPHSSSSSQRPGSALQQARAITVELPLCEAGASPVTPEGPCPPGRRLYCRMNSSSLPDVRDVHSLQSHGQLQPGLRRDDPLRHSQSRFYEMYI